MALRLNESEAEILLHTQLDADREHTEVARDTGIGAHSVRYHLERLRHRQAIHRLPFVNLQALGLQQYAIYFSVSPQADMPRERLFEVLRAYTGLIAIAELGGEYRYSVTLCAESIHEVSVFLDYFAERCGNICTRKIVVPLLSYCMVRRAYLGRDCGADLTQVLAIHPVKRCSVDRLDIAIVNELYRDGWLSNRQIAEKIGAPRATVNARLRKLQTQKVLQKMVYGLDAHVLGLVTYKMFVSTQGVKRGFKERFLAWALQHRSIAGLAHCMGSWDFELTFEFESTLEVSNTTEQMLREFGANIRDVQATPVFRQDVARRIIPETIASDWEDKAA